MPVEALDLLDEVLVVRDRDVLDVGCGEGSLARRFAAAGARAVGVDPQAIAVERAREATPAGEAAQFFEGGAQALPFAAASFDCVVFPNSLHHVPPGRVTRAASASAASRCSSGTPVSEGLQFEQPVRVFVLSPRPPAKEPA